MKTNLKRIGGLLLVTASVAALGSCKKKNNDAEDPGTHTYLGSFSLSPSTFNPLQYKSTTDAVPLDYTTNSWYEMDYNADKTGFELVPVMAAADPLDVTAQYGEFLAANDIDATANVAFRINLNKDAVWENGDKITADDYVYTMQQMLDPTFSNYRASNYYESQPGIVGAKGFVYSGRSGVGKATLTYSTYDPATQGDNLIFVWGEDDVPNSVFLNWVYNGDFSYLLGTDDYPTVIDYLGAFGGVFTGNDALYESMDGLTYNQIQQNAAMATALDELIDFWCSEENEELVFFKAEYSFPVKTWDDVGIKKVDEYTLDVIYTGELIGFYQKYTISLPLIHKATFENCLNVDSVTGAKTSTYGSSVDTYMGYGPYKFTRYIKDQIMEFDRNENWFGYSDKYADKYGTFIAEFDGKEHKQFETDRIVLKYITEVSTREEMFLAGELDSLGLDKALFAKYGKSDRLYNAKQAATWYGVICSDYDALLTREKELNKFSGEGEYNGAEQQYNKTILSIKEFRQAVCYSLNRKELINAIYPAGTVASSLFSDLIIADPENSVAFNSLDSTKEAVCAFWGVEYGEGKDFDTLDEAYNAITGYDPDKAKACLEAAVTKAKNLGYMGDNTIVSMDYCVETDSQTERQWYNAFKNCLSTLVKDSSLEGKFNFEFNISISEDFGTDIQSGKCDSAWGFGWSGGELDPYSLFEVYVDAAAAAGKDTPYQYDSWVDRDTADYKVTVNVDAGDGAKDYTYTVFQWWQILNGAKDAPMNWAFGKVADAVRAKVLAACEAAVLGDYTSIPLFNQGSNLLLSYKINYGRESYMFGMGFGGIRYTTYNFTDMEWEAFVAKQTNKTLSY